VENAEYLLESDPEINVLRKDREGKINRGFKIGRDFHTTSF